MKLFHKKLQPFTEMQKKYCVILERGGEEKERGRRKGGAEEGAEGKAGVTR